MIRNRRQRVRCSGAGLPNAFRQQTRNPFRSRSRNRAISSSIEVFGDNLLCLLVSRISLPRGAQGRRGGSRCRSLRSHDPIDAAGPCFLRLKRQSKLLLRDPGEEAPYRVRLPAGGLRNRRNGGTALGLEQAKDAVVLGCPSAQGEANSEYGRITLPVLTRHHRIGHVNRMTAME